MFFKKYAKKEDGAIRGFDMASTSARVGSVVIFIACIFMLIVALFPVVWAFLSSFKDVTELRQSTAILPKTFDFGGFVRTWNDLGFTQYYISSLVTVAGSVVCAVVLNGLLAYVLGVLKPVGHGVVFALVMSTLLIPPTTSIVALFSSLAQMGFTNSYLPLWLSMGANAFWVVLFKQFFESMPKDYVEAARLDGCSDFQIFLRIILPLSRPIVVVVAIFAVTASWSDFLLPYLINGGTAKETVMVRLFKFRTAIKVTDTDMLRASVFAIIPPTILFAIFQKQITSGIAAGGIKG